MLISACKANRVQAVEFLLKRGWTSTTATTADVRRSHYAARTFLQLIRMLVEANAEWNILDDDGRTPFGACGEGLELRKQFEGFEQRFPQKLCAEQTDECVCMEFRKSPLLKCSRCGRTVPLDLHGSLGAQRKARRLLDM